MTFKILGHALCICGITATALAQTPIRPAVNSSKTAAAAVQQTSAQTNKTRQTNKTSDLITRIAPQTISIADVEPHVRFLANPALRGRSGDEAVVAAHYLRRHFQKIGLRPLFPDGEYFQFIPGRKDENGVPKVMGRNVGAWLPGSDPKLRDEFIMVTAHYDHLGSRGGVVFPGADDNASGTAMMLEVAEKLAALKVRPKRSIAFVGFDLEEKMIWGSRWFAAHPPWPLEEKLKLFITADMIGRSLGDLPLPLVFVLGSEHAPELKTFLDEVGTPPNLEAARLGVDLIGIRSDYGPFKERHIPFLFFSTGEHPDYHSPRDTADRLDYRKVANVSSVIHQLVIKTGNSKITPKWRTVVEPDLDEARAIKRVADLLLLAEEQNIREFNALQRGMISHIKAQTTRMIEAGKMTVTQRKMLTRLSQVLLFSVF